MHLRLMILFLAIAWHANGRCRAAEPSLPEPGDWPCWRGPDRSGVSAETGLLKQWPKGGPSLRWLATELGGGYSTPSVAGGRVFLMGSRGSDEFVMALDIKDGHKLWTTRVGLVGENTGPNYPGPRSTPAVDGAFLYALGSDGDLVCADTATGTVAWRKHLLKDFQGKRGTWAYAECPLIDGDHLICTPGGATATMVALNKKTGTVIWKTAKPEYNTAAYASPIVIEVGGVRQYVQFLGSGLIGVADRDGRLLWTYSRHIGGVSAATPIFHDGCIFSTSTGMEGSGGDALIRLLAEGNQVRTKEVYLVRAMTNFHGGVVHLGDFLYGTGANTLICMDFRSGSRKWQDRSVGRGSLVAADGHLYLRNEQGAVALVEATSASYKETGRFQQPHRSKFPTFCHPVLAGGCLYLRDEAVLLCYDVKDRERRDSGPSPR